MERNQGTGRGIGKGQSRKLTVVVTDALTSVPQGTLPWKPDQLVLVQRLRLRADVMPEPD